MVNFKKTHNITNEQNFRSLIGYAGQELAISRLMMCGFNVLRSLWRDSKYDGMFEANNASIKIEIKQTTKEKFTVTSGSRSGQQISRSAENREAILKKEDADFFFGPGVYHYYHYQEKEGRRLPQQLQMELMSFLTKVIVSAFSKLSSIIYL